MRLPQFFLSVILLAFSANSISDPMSDSFSSGSAIANGQVNGIAAGITATGIQGVIPQYGASTTTQSGYYAGGNGDIEVPGATQINTCASATATNDPMADQYCNAVNFLATNPTNRPQFTIGKNDPLMQNFQAISQGASAILASNGMSATGTSSPCVPVTTTTPAQYTTEMCSTAKELTTTQCTMGRIVNIADNTNYQCNQTINAYQTSTCTRGSVVTVSAGQCTPGAVLASFVKDNACPACAGDWQIKVTITCGNDSTYVTEDDWYYPPGTNYQSMYQSLGYTAYPTYFVSFITTSSATSSTDFTNKPVFSGGDGCNLTMYLTQLCSGMVCSLAVSENGNCAEGSFTLPAQNIAVPYTVSANFSNDGCATFEAQAQ